LPGPRDLWLPGFNFNVEEWFENDQYETALARAAFAAAIAEKPSDTEYVSCSDINRNTGS
jgi:hypothetical protein